MPRSGLLFLLGIAFIPSLGLAQVNPQQTVALASSVLTDSMSSPKERIPQNLLARARGVAIIPNVVKGGFVVGVRHGRGVVLVRDDAGRWTPPMFASLSGGSVGWQAGIQATDVILVFMTRRSVNGLMNGKFTIGADAAAAAGPLGRQAAAATDAALQAEILSYSRSRGLFAGVSIDGSVLQLDHLAGGAYYGAPVVSASGQVLQNSSEIPAGAVQLVQQLSLYSGGGEEAVVATSVSRPAKTGNQQQLVAAEKRLASSWAQLSGVLEPHWQTYLAPPGAETSEDQAVEILREKLQRYNTVSSDARYRVLADHPAFRATHQLLRECLQLRATQPPSKLTLPPPPASPRAR